MVPRGHKADPSIHNNNKLCLDCVVVVASIIIGLWLEQVRKAPAFLQLLPFTYSAACSAFVALIEGHVSVGRRANQSKTACVRTMLTHSALTKLCSHRVWVWCTSTISRSFHCYYLTGVFFWARQQRRHVTSATQAQRFTKPKLDNEFAEKILDLDMDGCECGRVYGRTECDSAFLDGEA